MNDKLERLADLEGYDDYMDMLEDATYDSVVPAICTNPDCDATSQLEPDGEGGLCENCGTNTMTSCLILAGLV